MLVWKDCLKGQVTAMFVLFDNKSTLFLHVSFSVLLSAYNKQSLTSLQKPVTHCT